VGGWAGLVAAGGAPRGPVGGAAKGKQRSRQARQWRRSHAERL